MSDMDGANGMNGMSEMNLDADSADKNMQAAQAADASAFFGSEGETTEDTAQTKTIESTPDTPEIDLKARMELLEAQNALRATSEAAEKLASENKTLAERLKALEEQSKKHEADSDINEIAKGLNEVLGEELGTKLNRYLQRISEAKPTGSAYSEDVIKQKLQENLQAMSSQRQAEEFQAALLAKIPDIGARVGDGKFIAWAKAQKDGINTIYDNLLTIQSRRSMGDVDHVDRYIKLYDESKVKAKPKTTPTGGTNAQGMMSKDSNQDELARFFAS